MTILEELSNKSDGARFIIKLETIRNNAKNILAKISEIFPEYTPHTIEHKDKVLKNLDIILPKPLQQKLNSYELFFLASGVYLHDIGMADLDGISYFEEFSNDDEKKELIRKYHHLRSQEFISKNFLSLGIENEHESEIIGLICIGHRKTNLHDKIQFDPNYAYLDKTVNIPFLAASLKLADELDLTFSRTPMIVYENMPIRNKISQDEWKKHLSISGVSLHPEDSSIILCTATCKEPYIHRMLKELENKINLELSDFVNHLNHYREFRNEIPRFMNLKITAINYKPYDFKFTLQNNEIVKLLMGDQLYTHSDESIREILKNSYDACRLKISSLKKQNLSYSPIITMELLDDQLLISDNGEGMDEDIVERYFTRIGRSFYRSVDDVKNDYGFTPVSELGIGVLSCFMIADKVIVNTKKDGALPLHIEIDDVSGFFFVKDGTKQESGTEIKLSLKKDFINLGIEQIVRKFAQHLKYPIMIKLSNSKTVEICNKEFTPDSNVFIPPLRENTSFLNIEINDDYCEGVIALLGSDHDHLEWIPSQHRLNYSYHDDEKRSEPLRYFISKEGIFVNSVPLVPSWLSTRFLYFDIDIKNNSLDLDASRNRIKNNTKQKQFVNHIEQIILDKFSNYLVSLKEKLSDQPELYNQIAQLLIDKYISVSTRIYSYDDESKKISPDLMKFLQEYHPYKRYMKDSTKSYSIDQINNMSGKIILLSGMPRNQNIISKIFECSGFVEDEVYLEPISWDGGIDGKLLKNFEFKNYIQYFDISYSKILKDINLKTWKAGEISNYPSKSFLIEFHWGSSMINLKHPFAKLLVDHKTVIVTSRKLSLNGFLRNFKNNFKHHFDKLVEDQKNILQFFVDDGIISEEDIPKYLLTINDYEEHN